MIHMITILRISSTAAILTLTFILCSAQDKQHITALDEPYLGQTPPGNTPEIFALGIIGTDLHGCPVFAPDGMEAYWSLMSNMKMMYSKVVNGIWTTPEEFEFPPEFVTSDVPCLTTDGNCLFFVSTAPINKEKIVKENIWFMDRDGDGWTIPQPLSNIVNKNELHWQLSVAENGNLYFSYLGPTGIDIALSRFVDGQYAEAEVLGPEINRPWLEQEFAPFIAPDESYLIFSYVNDGSSNPYVDLFISFRKSDGSWTQAVPMEGLNTDGAHEMCANVTRDGKYLFFLKDASGGIATHWVSANVINDYRVNICGDANNDASVNIGDVVYITNHVFKNAECATNPPIGCPPDPYNDGDVNCDGTVNVGDSVYLGNIVFRPGSPVPCEGCE